MPITRQGANGCYPGSRGMMRLVVRCGKACEARSAAGLAANERERESRLGRGAGYEPGAFLAVASYEPASSVAKFTLK